MAVDRLFAFSSLLVFAVAGCSRGGVLSEVTTTSTATSFGAALAQTTESTQNPVVADTADRHIVRDGELTWQTDSRADSFRRIQTAVQKSGGYLSEDQVCRYDRRTEQRLVLRVPAENFETLVADISDGVDHFDSRHLTARDVTEEFVDLDIRLHIKKDTEARYRELLQEADNVTEILKVEAELGKLRADIEATEGRLNVLRNQVAYSTLRVRFYEPIRASSHFGGRILNSLRLGWLGLIEFVVGLAVLWPVMGLLTIVGIVVRRKLRARRVSGSAVA